MCVAMLVTVYYIWAVLIINSRWSSGQNGWCFLEHKCPGSPKFNFRSVQFYVFLILKKRNAHCLQTTINYDMHAGASSQMDQCAHYNLILFVHCGNLNLDEVDVEHHFQIMVECDSHYAEKQQMKNDEKEVSSYITLQNMVNMSLHECANTRESLFSTTQFSPYHRSLMCYET